MKFLNSIEFRNFNIDMGKLNEISPEELSEIMKPGAAGVLVMTKSGEFYLQKEPEGQNTYHHIGRFHRVSQM